MCHAPSHPYARLSYGRGLSAYMRRSWPAVSEVIQSRARFSARTRAQGMVRGGFERCAHVDMRVPGAQPCCTAGATALCPLSAPARHRQHTRHEIWMGKRSQAALEVRYCAPGWPFGPSYELADRLVAWSSGQLGHRRPKGRWRISSPLSVRRAQPYPYGHVTRSTCGAEGGQPGG